jgi:perosamine synthetase
MKAQIPIPLAKPSIGKLELSYVTRAVESSWIGPSGEFLERMQSHLNAELGTRHCIPVANGTVALHLALLALGISEGDEVIVPSFTYIASVNAIRYCGATPVFVDIEEDSWCLDPEKIEDLVSAKTKAIMVVHLYGMPANMDSILRISKKYNLKVIEDAAESLFATYRDKKVGNLGDVATFSFFGNKILATGEGGALVTNNDEIAEKINLLKGQGMSPSKRYWFPIMGYNYRMTNVAAAIFCAQFERRDEILDCRNDIYEKYDSYFSTLEYIQLQSNLENRTRAPWSYPILVAEAVNSESIRDSLMHFLAQKQIETRPFFYPVHTMPPYLDCVPQSSLEYTNTISKRGLNLPTFVGLSDEEIEYVFKSVVSFQTL